MAKLMSLQAREKMLESIKEKYHSGDWKTKHKLIDGFVATTRYEHKHAIKLLNRKKATITEDSKHHGKRATRETDEKIS